MAEIEEIEETSSWILSDWFLGVLVVILSAATAFAAFQSTMTGIEGDDLDNDSQKALLLATTSFLTANTEFMEDLQTYDSFKLLSDQNSGEGAEFLKRASPALIAGLERPEGPFDEIYEASLYNDALELFKHVEKIEEEANLADDALRINELAGLIFAVGLASTAWASLVGPRRRIRQIFVIVALICLVGGIVVASRVLFL